jgi:hypothetical protein
MRTGGEITGALTQEQIELIRAQISPCERLCWAGQEPSSRHLRKHAWRIAIFAGWTGVAGFFAARSIVLNPYVLRYSMTDMLSALTPLILAVLGGVFLVREILVWQKIGPDLYALTNRRALVITPGKGVISWRYNSNAARSIQVRRRKNGSGDIIFERCARWSTDAEGRATRQVNDIGFYGLRCVDEVLCRLEDQSSLKFL